jgi:nicotinamidase-related amidase
MTVLAMTVLKSRARTAIGETRMLLRRPRAPRQRPAQDAHHRPALTDGAGNSPAHTGVSDAAMSQRSLVHGPLGEHTIHLCVDMQNMFALDTPWRVDWMPQVLPAVREIAERQPHRTVFTRFVPPARAEDATGTWRRYFEHWREFTGERIDPRWIELLPPLAALVPPAAVVDKDVYSPFATPELVQLLRRRNADCLVITGAETDVCVLAAVLAALDHGYRIVLPVDAMCSASDRTHDALLTLYRERFNQQIETTDTATVVENWH